MLFESLLPAPEVRLIRTFAEAQPAEFLKRSMKCRFFFIWLSIVGGLRVRTWTSRVQKSPSACSSDDFGQSFIGQDVCGSKYNDDPFNAAESKGSAWQDFQRRVMEKEAAELAAAKNITQTEALILVELKEKEAPGKWP